MKINLIGEEIVSKLDFKIQIEFQRTEMRNRHSKEDLRKGGEFPICRRLIGGLVWLELLRALHLVYCPVVAILKFVKSFEQGILCFHFFF